MRQLVRTRRTTNLWALILLLTPTFFFLAVFLLWPIVESFRLSTLDWDGIQPEQQNVGLANWTELVRDRVFWLAVRNSFLLMFTSICIQIPVALGLAVLLDRGAKRFRFFKVAFFFPMLMSSVAIAILFRSVYDYNFGLLNGLLSAVGLENLTQDWLGDPKWAIWSVVLVVSWQFIPFYMLLFLAALQGIPQDVREASVLDGTNDWQYSRLIQIPMLRGAIAVAILLIAIGSLKYFDLIWIMTGTGPDQSTTVLATYMYEAAFRSYRVGYGAAISSALFLIVFFAALLVLRLTRRVREDV